MRARELHNKNLSVVQGHVGMVKDSLFEGLPPPATSSACPPAKVRPESTNPGPLIRATAILSKRTLGKSDTEGNEGAKRVRFKSNEVEASEELVLGAMGKIAAHIGKPDKFSKASKLAVQLLQCGGVKSETVDAFFEILRVAMTSPSRATELKLWADYHTLFSAVLEKIECFGPAQQAQIEVWELWAVLANEFRTDDTFVFSKASARVRQYVNSLPDANEEDEGEGGNKEQSGLEASSERVADNSLLKVKFERRGEIESNENIVENDPFRLNALMPRLSKKEERARRKKDEEAASLQAYKDSARLLKERREALITCLKIAADHYRLQWAQTIIDILVKHAYDSVTKFTVCQRYAIEQMWGCIREQLVYRKQCKSTSGKLDVTPFEHLQSQYAREHISIRRAVGSSGERSAEQWLG